jgi:hypothetical protein
LFYLVAFLPVSVRFAVIFFVFRCSYRFFKARDRLSQLNLIPPLLNQVWHGFGRLLQFLFSSSVVVAFRPRRCCSGFFSLRWSSQPKFLCRILSVSTNLCFVFIFFAYLSSMLKLFSVGWFAWLLDFVLSVDGYRLWLLVCEFVLRFPYWR